MPSGLAAARAGQAGVQRRVCDWHAALVARAVGQDVRW